jgi:hypothetical protein
MEVGISLVIQGRTLVPGDLRPQTLRRRTFVGLVPLWAPRSLPLCLLLRR